LALGAAETYTAPVPATPPDQSADRRAGVARDVESALLSIRAMRPETSPGPPVGMRITSNGPPRRLSNQDYQVPLGSASLDSLDLDFGALKPTVLISRLTFMGL
jgi:hypothetical protein